MTTEERLAALEAKFSAQKAELDKTIKENLAKDKQITQLNAASQELFEAEEERAKQAERGGLFAKLEGLVKERKINPATREKFMRDFDEAEDASDAKKVSYAVENLIKTIESNPAFFSTAEQARKQAQREEEENELPADQVVVTRIREHQEKHNSDFKTAKTAVLRADPELAGRYVRVEY